MPRYYNVGPDGLDATKLAEQVAVDDEDSKRIAAEMRKHHPLSQPARSSLVAKDGRVFVRKPAAYSRIDPRTNQPMEELLPYEKGSICFGIQGYGYWVVPANTHVDLDVSIPEPAIRARAPHLISEAEAIARGFAKSPDAPAVVRSKGKHNDITAA